MHCKPPLLHITWDGFSLSFGVEPGQDLELLVDGQPFARWPGNQKGKLRQGFGFLPNGRQSMRLCLHSNEAALHAPMEVRFGEPGWQPADGAVRPMLLLDGLAEHYMSPTTGEQVDATTVVIVPVFNAPDCLARCLASLREHTPAGARLLLIDDASDDPAVAPLLAMAEAWPNVTVLRNERNLGFTGSVNRGLARCAADADVVLLNADAEVGPGWLAGLRQAAWAQPEHATATAVSDNAGAFSVPELEQVNPLPHGWSVADAARCVLHSVGRVFPGLPTGNGFCMYMRHDALAAVGELDAEAFPVGYGEENDWCQRAEQQGWRHVIAGSVFVGHAGSRSFGEQRRRKLGAAGMQVLRQRYPDYEAKVGAQLFSFARQVLDWRVRRLWHDARAVARPRVLLQGEPDPLNGWSGWATWRLHQHGGLLRLLDAGGNEREATPVARTLEVVPVWLQRYGFEAMQASAGGSLGAVCLRLGIPAAAAPHEMRWSFR